MCQGGAVDDGRIGADRPVRQFIGTRPHVLAEVVKKIPEGAQLICGELATVLRVEQGDDSGAELTIDPASSCQ
ncbi:hypothetical protein [Haloechinothrix sp. LS1_15]|uniref:hypothetical protein n=1 Tax=Haloechinothrix sp. LS1_15 TaxID=2652248 RepID=UPI00294AA83C|nr:hypothetical protein [Haloechinothrix sp. LS1_15]